MSNNKIQNDLKDYVTKNITDIAESHIDCWKDRYFRKSKKEIEFDLQVNHDSSGEVESAEIELNRKLTDKEADYLINKFNKQVVRVIY